MAPDIKFIADSMLGKLARWLRAAGYDTTYDPFIADRELLRQARAEARIILTRDSRMLEVRDIPPYLFIKDDYLEEQLAQVVQELGLEPNDADFVSRCLECNSLLEEIPKSEVASLVPPYVFEKQNNFRRCPGCERIYWGGTHVPRLKAKIRRLFGQRVGDPSPAEPQDSA